MPPVAAWLLIAIFAISPSWAASDDGLGVSPLYDYRYTQVAEDLGILGSGSSESKLAYESIETSSLNPQEPSGISGADAAGDSIFKQPDTSGDICPFETEDTCFASCGSTCTNTCGGTCTNTCAPGCQTSTLTCGSTCGSTCGNTCGTTCTGTCTNTCAPGCQTSTLTCGSTCTRTCSSTCANTCSKTCANTCGSTCGYTCYSTCRNTCAPTCSNTCMRTCSYTCANTCANTCLSTCSNTCKNTCAQTCSATCGSKCQLTPVKAAPLANSTSKAPAQKDQGVLIQYNVTSTPPSAVFYDGISMPWSEYQKRFAGNYLLAWIEIYDGSWGVEARAPLGSWVREFVYVPVSGNLTMSEVTPDGRTYSQNFGPATPGYKFVWHQADAPGKHSRVFAIGTVKSSEIDLTAF